MKTKGDSQSLASHRNHRHRHHLYHSRRDFQNLRQSFFLTTEKMHLLIVPIHKAFFSENILDLFSRGFLGQMKALVKHLTTTSMSLGY